jgi:hypothetical protein
MRIALLTVGFALLLATRADAACLPAIQWRGDYYQGYKQRAELGKKLTPQAIVPACNDAGQNAPDTKTTAYRLPSLASAVAVSTRGWIWVNVHTFPQLPGHPLHERLGYDRGKPAQRKGRRCAVAGTVSSTVGSIVIGRPERYIDVDAASTITLRKHGIEWIEEGDKIRVRGSCTGSRVLADRIDRA